MKREDIIKDIAIKVVYNLRSILEEKGINATGALSKSIKYSVAPTFLEISFNEYGVDVDTGTPPHKVEISKLIKWVKAKGILVSPWAIQNSIMVKGTKANPWILEFKRTLLNFDKDMLKVIDLEVTNIDKKLKRLWQ